MAARRSFIFVGSNFDPKTENGNVKMFELLENKQSITSNTAYGRIKMDELAEVATYKMRDMVFTDTLQAQHQVSTNGCCGNCKAMMISNRSTFTSSIESV